MKTDLSYLPSHKQEELTRIAEAIRTHAPSVEMVILFGSYARGDWVEEKREEDGRWQYQSDYDLLLIVKTPSESAQARIETEIEREIDRLRIKTPVSIIVHGIDYVNTRLRRKQYFFSDIKQQGVVLYDSGAFILDEPVWLSAKDRREIAQEDFRHYMGKANELTMIALYAIDTQAFTTSAFLLHQITERLYTAALLVFTRYKPNTHDLNKLRGLVNSLDTRFASVFCDPQSRCFKLLCKGYVDARYKPSYTITKEELLWLEEEIQRLMQLTCQLCEEKISLF